MRHALAELSNLAANLCEFAAQPRDLAAQPTNTREDQPCECDAHSENGNDFSAHLVSIAFAALIRTGSGMKTTGSAYAALIFTASARNPSLALDRDPIAAAPV